MLYVILNHDYQLVASLTLICIMVPTRQDVYVRYALDLICARMKVFRTSFFVADVKKTLNGRRVRVWLANHIIRTPGRKRTSGKLSYWPKVGRPLNVTSECAVLLTTLAEWITTWYAQCTIGQIDQMRHVTMVYQVKCIWVHVHLNWSILFDWFYFKKIFNCITRFQMLKSFVNQQHLHQFWMNNKF